MDSGYLGSGIGALEECTRLCVSERQPFVNLLIGQAFKILRMPLKTYSYWKAANEQNQKLLVLPPKDVRQLSQFLDEYHLFTRLTLYADKEIKAAIEQGEKFNEHREE